MDVAKKLITHHENYNEALSTAEKLIAEKEFRCDFCKNVSNSKIPLYYISELTKVKDLIIVNIVRKDLPVQVI